ncbi:SPW repeat protein [Dyadobacter chenwenxiniae]|uniref:SPW repeat protein n=1 Tax=Dyadobacter chenwenxiniae TaxID=2906456 RepID=A0A9X1TM95_9BACT|nr:SPW repeat protein [Dyadobacter chenwenxiniae]MCF0063268.1 SPW repeat protein [Dyadobacter chenwenxiniae]UON85352.1 SPW repeat protein [Dyadobacter chenwenxiniae]
MNVISTKLHSRIDYTTSILFIAMPWILGFNDVLPATWTLIAVGCMSILMSLFMDYEGGMVRSLPMAAHLNIDIATGLFLAASPWILGFADEVYLPHLLLGLFEVAAGLMTRRVAQSDEADTLEHSQQP